MRLVHVLLLALALALAGGCARPPREAILRAVPSVPAPGEGFEVVGADLAVDDTSGIHVVFALARPGGPPAQVQYAFGRLAADSVRWETWRVLIPEGGDHPRIVVADTILHVLAGERLRHLASTNGGRGWHDLATLIPPDSTWSIRFDVATAGGSVLVASVGKRSLPDVGSELDEDRQELHVFAWRMGNRVESRLLAVYRSGRAYELDPSIAVRDSGVEVACAVYGAEDSAAVDRWRSRDEGSNWTEADDPDPSLVPERNSTPPADLSVLARATAQGRVLTLSSRRGEPRVFLSIEWGSGVRPSGTAP
jgi:hypothetical protein